MKYFHMTEKKNIESIKKDGLIINKVKGMSSESDKKPYVYLTADPRLHLAEFIPPEWYERYCWFEVDVQNHKAFMEPETYTTYGEPRPYPGRYIVSCNINPEYCLLDNIYEFQ